MKCEYKVENPMALPRYKYLCGHPRRIAKVCDEEMCTLDKIYIEYLVLEGEE